MEWNSMLQHTVIDPPPPESKSFGFEYPVSFHKLKREVEGLQWMCGRRDHRFLQQASALKWKRVKTKRLVRLCVKVFSLSSSGGRLCCLPVSVFWAPWHRQSIDFFISLRGEHLKQRAESHPLCLAYSREIQIRCTHSYQIRRIHTAIHKHDLLIIPVSSSSFAFLSAVASDVLSLVCMCEKQLPRDPLSCFPQLSSSSHSLPTSFMLLCVNPAVFPNNANVLLTSDISVAFLWEREGICDQLSGNLFWLLVAHVRMATPASTVERTVCQWRFMIILTWIWGGDLRLRSAESQDLTFAHACLKMSLKINSDRYDGSWFCSWMCHVTIKLMGPAPFFIPCLHHLFSAFSLV